MEEEVTLYLKIGLLTVIIPITSFVSFRLIKFKRQGFGWFLTDLILFYLGALA